MQDELLKEINDKKRILIDREETISNFINWLRTKGVELQRNGERPGI